MKFVKQNYEGHNHFLQILNAYSQKMDHFIHFWKSKNFFCQYLKGLVAAATLLFILSFSSIHNHIHTVYSFTSIRRGLSPFLHSCFAQREKPPWGAEPGFELGPAIQQASALPTEPRGTLGNYLSSSALIPPSFEVWRSLLIMCEYEDNFFFGQRRPVLKATWILFRVQRPWHQSSFLKRPGIPGTDTDKKKSNFPHI